MTFCQDTPKKHIFRKWTNCDFLLIELGYHCFQPRYVTKTEQKKGSKANEVSEATSNLVL